MKKIMSLMLGLSLVFGVAAFAADEKKADATTAAAPAKEKKAKKAKKEVKADAAAEKPAAK